jgi:hypothetical protein
MAKKKRKFARVSLKPIVRKLTKLGNAAAKGKKAAITKSDKKAFGARMTTINRAKKRLMAICDGDNRDGFYI